MGCCPECPSPRRGLCSKREEGPADISQVLGKMIKEDRKRIKKIRGGTEWQRDGIQGRKHFERDPVRATPASTGEGCGLKGRCAQRRAHGGVWKPADCTASRHEDLEESGEGPHHTSFNTRNSNSRGTGQWKSDEEAEDRQRETMTRVAKFWRRRMNLEAGMRQPDAEETRAGATMMTRGAGVGAHT